MRGGALIRAGRYFSTPAGFSAERSYLDDDVEQDEHCKNSCEAIQEPVREE
jgi:hypothetical protein